ncbi:hypothetical protein MKQ70_15975 [Chitinophaga sedimenti]|uniref:hypothetical protein n=1 Tax=Chitinophaga sedimenti TaxID=2033606 RepID=UPI0020060FA3|nr:hypothetical protein [Chitinophaga sedimenti]MCK7556432.1 hypothetical protein [Chitinophaga sedimenti]
MNMLEAYKKCWVQGSRKRNAYVIEPHLDFLIDALGMAKKGAGVKLGKALKEVREKLKNLS